MSIKFLLTILLISISLPVFAVNCMKKPCHKKCIESQPESVKTQCMCNKRKKVYYHYWGTNYGVPEHIMLFAMELLKNMQ